MDRHTEFLKLYHAAQPSLRGYLLAWLGDFHQAEDLVQQTSLVLWEQFPSYRAGTSFTAWALGIAKNLALKELRQNRTTPSLLANPEVMDLVAETYDRATPDLEWRRQRLVACVERLTGALRRVVELYYMQSLKIAKVAQIMGRSSGGIEVSLARARRLLVECTRRGEGVQP